jgi:hypothetical protein
MGTVIGVVIAAISLTAIIICALEGKYVFAPHGRMVPA